MWGIPSERDSLYPSLRKIIAMDKESIAARSGFQVNEEALALDGVPASDRETWNRLMAAKNWGDHAVVTVRRAGAEVRIPVDLRRVVKEKR